MSRLYICVWRFMIIIGDKMKQWIRGWVLLWFMQLFEKEMEDVEPGVSAFFAKILKPYANASARRRR